ncbi:MAG: addiction module antidote protein [Arenicellales bacterium]
MKTTTFDVSEYLDSPEMIAEYLNAALEEGDTEYLMKALGNVAKAKGMANIAEETGLGRESLYKAVSGSVNPKLETVQRIFHAVGVDIKVISRV